MIDELDQPNTAPGTCPDCGQKANIWNAMQQEWECSFCDWKGRNPKREITMKIDRKWSMPNKDTFSIAPIRDLIHDLVIEKTLGNKGVICDPFVGLSPFADVCLYTNDLNPDIEANSHIDALEFLQSLPVSSVDLMLFDPPYSPRQVSEVYKRFGKTVNMQTTQASYWSKLKQEISRITKSGGKCVTCGWNSGGIGNSYGFYIERILLVPHGGWHNDTICTVEVKQ
jgi:hypothetical protein